MIVLSALVNIIASLLGNVLVGVSVAVLHVLAISSLLIISAGVAIVSPGLFLFGLLILAVLYLSGSIR